jgi:hypothetical protein
VPSLTPESGHEQPALLQSARGAVQLERSDPIILALSLCRDYASLFAPPIYNSSHLFRLADAFEIRSNDDAGEKILTTPSATGWFRTREVVLWKCCPCKKLCSI